MTTEVITLADQRIKNLLELFHSLQSWEERYQELVRMGKSLSPMESQYQIDENKVRGCQSQVWLSVKVIDEGRLHFEADSDALIVKGLISILISVYQDLKPDEILKVSPQFIKDLGFEQHLSPSRANGLQAMLKQIQFYAIAYQQLLNRA